MRVMHLHLAFLQHLNFFFCYVYFIKAPSGNLVVILVQCFHLNLQKLIQGTVHQDVARGEVQQQDEGDLWSYHGSWSYQGSWSYPLIYDIRLFWNFQIFCCPPLSFFSLKDQIEFWPSDHPSLFVGFNIQKNMQAFKFSTLNTPPDKQASLNHWYLELLPPTGKKDAYLFENS